MTLLLLACAYDGVYTGYDATWGGDSGGYARCVNGEGAAVLEVDAWGEGDVYNAGVVVVSGERTWFRPLPPAGHRAWSDDVVLPGVATCAEAVDWTFWLALQVPGQTIVGDLCPITRDCGAIPMAR